MIIDQVKKTIEDRNLIKKGDKVLVCVSGGADSMALLHLLAALRDEYQMELVVVHLDHCLRGRHSQADAAFVKKAAAALKLPFVMQRRDVRRAARLRKMSLEEAGREARYDFFQKIAAQTGADKIATGHTLDDQAETLLMRFVTGSGSRGLSGIPYLRKVGSAYVIRPLLDVKRADIEGYLKKRRIPSRNDASNFTSRYLRNRIRHELIPLLERDFNPRIKENLKALSEHISDEYDYVNAAARRAARCLTSTKKGAVTLDVRRFRRRHPALQRLIFRQIILSLKGDLNKITSRHWEGLESAFTRRCRPALDLPGGIRIKKIRENLVFLIDRPAPRRAAHFTGCAAVKVPGNTTVPELGIRIRSEIVATAPRFRRGKRKNRVEYIDGDFTRSALKIRTRRHGDRMTPLGMTSPKKLHDIFVDEKVPREMRDNVPLLVSGKRILWAVGVKLSEDGKVSGYGRKAVKLTALPSRCK